MTFATTSSRWAALQSRDPAATTAFIYSVTTTKIYCRPTCPSRLARRANITFHNNPAEAEVDGFRPCKRCRPEVSENDGDSQKLAVAKACEILVNGKDDDAQLSVKALAAKVGLTECHFCRVFKKIMGVTVGSYRKALQHQNVARTETTTTNRASVLDLDQSLLSNTGTPSDHLDTPNELDLPAAWNTITQTDIDALNNGDYQTSLFDLIDLDYVGYKLPEPDNVYLSEPADVGGGEGIFDFLDFENHAMA